MAWLAVKNDSSIPSISVYTEEKRIFSDILRGEVSEYAFFSSGTAVIAVYDNFSKPLFEVPLSVPPCKRLVLSVGDGGICVE